AFHIDTSDRSHEESASDTDFRAQAQAQAMWGWGSASLSTSLSYVSSHRATSDAEINTQTDLTGEVELHFKSDYFPLSRFAPAAQTGQIRGTTPVPDANAPSAEAAESAGPFDSAPAVGGDVPRTQVHRTNVAPSYRPIGTPPPPARSPDAVTPVTP